MKEFTEIIIDEARDKNQFLEQKFIAFDARLSDFPRAKYLGFPVSFENNVLKLKTQMYFENIPLKEMNAHAEVEIFTSSRKVASIGTGIIKSKYYINSTKQDWELKKPIEEGTSDIIELDIQLKIEEYKAFELGDIPLSMDDKWFMYLEEDEFHYYRSWTGLEVFKGKLLKSIIEPNQWEIKEVEASKEWDASLAEKKGLIESLITHGIKRKMKLFG